MLPEPTPATLSTQTSLSEPSPDATITERCYGLILLRHAPNEAVTTMNTSILLIHQKRPPPLLPYWGFPKGHPETGDASPWATALRELREETGLDPDTVQRVDLGPVAQGGRPLRLWSQYPSRMGGVKQVTYFVGTVEEHDEVTVQDEEVVECRWVVLGDAWEIIKMGRVMDVLGKVIQYVRREIPVDERETEAW